MPVAVGDWQLVPWVCRSWMLLFPLIHVLSREPTPTHTNCTLQCVHEGAAGEAGGPLSHMLPQITSCLFSFAAAFNVFMKERLEKMKASGDQKSHKEHFT